MIIGIDLGGTNVRAGAVENGKVLKFLQSELAEKDSLESTVGQICSIIAALVNDKVRGIGIGVPSVVDVERGIVYNAVNIPSWKKVELKEILEERFKIPVFVNNDVNCLALGEKMHGIGDEFNSFVSLAIGTGLGAAIIIDSKLYGGLMSGAGELGYIPYLDSNLEHYASGMYFESFSTTARESFEAAGKGELPALELWKSYGHHLGQAMKIVMYTYAPEAIIIGGSISKAFRFFEPDMNKSMSDFLFPDLLKRVRIMPSSMENIAILGAAALVEMNSPDYSKFG